MKNKLMNRITKRVRQTTGETLTETLVALLIGTIGLAMLASMIGSSANLVSKSGTELANYYGNCKALITQKNSDLTNTDEVPGSTAISGTATIDTTSFYLTGTSASSPCTIYSYTYGGTAITTIK